MSTQIDIQNSAASIDDVTKFSEMPEEERKDIQNIDEARREARADISKTKKILRKIQKLQEQGGLSESEQAQAQELIDYLTEVIEAHQELYDYLQNKSMEEQIGRSEETETPEETPEEPREITLEAQNGSPVNISSTTFESKKDIVVKVQGQAHNPFAEPDKTDDEKLLEEGVIDENGIVVKDVNGDGLYSHLDKIEALEKIRKESDRPETPVVSVQMFRNERVDLVSYDKDQDKAIFKISGKHGVIYLKVENASGVIIDFAGGTVNYSPSWPTALRIKIGGEIQAADQGEMTGDEKLKSLPGREGFLSQEAKEMAKKYIYKHAHARDIRNNQSYEQLEALRKKYGEMIFNAIANFIPDEKDPDKKINFAEIWKQIIADMRGQGIPDMDIMNVLNMLIVTLVMSVPVEQFQTIAGGNSTKVLEDALMANRVYHFTRGQYANKPVTKTWQETEGTEFDKLSIIILEYAGNSANSGGYFGGPTGIFELGSDSPFAFIEGDHAIYGRFIKTGTNIKALELAKELMREKGLGLPESATKCLEAEKVILYGPPLHISANTVKIVNEGLTGFVKTSYNPVSAEEYDRRYNGYMHPSEIERVQKILDEINSRLTETMINDYVQKLWDIVKSMNGKPAKNIADTIMNSLNAIPQQPDRGIVAIIFISMIEKYDHNILRSLARSPEFVNGIKNAMNNPYIRYYTQTSILDALDKAEQEAQMAVQDPFGASREERDFIAGEELSKEEDDAADEEAES